MYREAASLLRKAAAVADLKSDGHLTILKFTTEWKVMKGTPDLDGADGREQVAKLEGYNSLEEALEAFVNREVGFLDDDEEEED